MRAPRLSMDDSLRASLSAVLAICLLGMACSRSSPIRPTDSGGAIGAADRRIGTISGGGGDEGVCIGEDDPDICLELPGSFELVSAHGGTFSGTCRVRLASTLPIGFFECRGHGSGRFAGGEFLGRVIDDFLHLDGASFLLRTAIVEADFAFTAPLLGGQTFVTAGTLGSQVLEMRRPSACAPGDAVLRLQMNGTLPHLGRVTGSLLVPCPAS